MTKIQPAAKIYLSKNRVIAQTDTTLTISSQFFDRASSTIICDLKEVQIKAQSNWTLTTQTNSSYFLLPLVGGIELKEMHKDSFFVLNGQLFQYQNAQAEQLTFINPYDQNDIRFLLIEVKGNNKDLTANYTSNLPVAVAKNQLLTVTSNKIKLGFGQYEGRVEEVYRTKETSLLLGYVIQGAFEFQNRLLESGDGISLWRAKEIEWEALSNNALLLLLEIACSS